MLRCPKCNRTYTTDSQKFCTHDGGRLSAVEATPPDFNPNATVQGNFAQFKEMGSMPGPVTPPAPPSIPPPPATAAPPPELNKTVMGAPIEPATPTAPTVTDLAPTSQDLPPAPDPEVSSVPTGEAPAELEEEATVWSMPVPSPPMSVPPELSAPTLVDPPSASTQVNPPPASTYVSEPHAYEPEPSFATQVSPPSEQFTPPEPMPPPPPVAAPAAMPVGSPYASAAQAAKLEAMIAAPPKKNRRLGLIFALVAVLLLLFLGAVGIAGFLYWNNLKKNEVANNNTTNANSANNNSPTANTNTSGTPANTNTSTPPAGLETFRNTLVSLDGPLADHYSDFSFSYPTTWKLDPDAGAKGKFVDMSLMSEDGDPAENLVVSYYESTGTLATDRAAIDRIIAQKNASFASGLTNYQKLSEGETTVNGIAGYEFRFQGKIGFKGTPDIWGRMIFLPPGTAGQSNGITFVMYATSRSADVHGPTELGQNGGLATILNSFKLGR